MSDASTLRIPALQQTELDAATLDQLFADLAQCTQILAVVPRQALRMMVAGEAISLDAAHAALRAGTLRGVQVRYRFENREWCDTLLPLSADRTRLVRICSDDLPCG